MYNLKFRALNVREMPEQRPYIKNSLREQGTLRRLQCHILGRLNSRRL